MKIKPYIILTRPVNVVITFISILAGGLVTGIVKHPSALLWAAVSGALIGAGGNSVNDYFDVEIDRINKPERPVASGKISLESALYFSVFLFVAGILLSAMINLPVFIIAVLASLAVFFYSYKLKKMMFYGNFCVAFVSGTAFVYGGVAAGNYLKSIIVGAFAFFFHFSREIIKDCEDIEGDIKYDAKTIPVKLGIKSALLIARVVLALLIVFTVSVYFTGVFGLNYLLIVIPFVDFVLLYIIYSLGKNQSRKHLADISTLMKIDMLFGLLAVYLGR